MLTTLVRPADVLAERSRGSTRFGAARCVRVVDAVPARWPRTPETAARVQLIDHTDEVWMSDGASPRDSTLTTMRRQGSTLFVLGSGHGTLPFGPDGHLLERFVRGESARSTVTINDGGGGFYEGELLAGTFSGGRAVDFGVFQVNNVRDADYDSWHAATGSLGPQLASPTVPRPGDEVFHVSRLPNRPNRLIGRVEESAVALVELDLPDGRIGRYSGAISVRGKNHPKFSVGGESGSLVVNEHREVVGTVLGAEKNGLSYVVPIEALMAALVRFQLDLFFESKT